MLSIGSGGTGGVYYPLGGGMANILTKYVPGYQATAEVTGGSVDNLKLVGSGRADIAFSMVDAAWDAYKGQDKFKDGKLAVRTLMVLYPNRMHVVTVDGTGINKHVGPEGQARVDGLAGQRDRGDGVARAGGARHRQRQGHQARAPVGSRSRSTRSRTGRSTRSSGSAACLPRPSPISPPRRASRSS